MLLDRLPDPFNSFQTSSLIYLVVRKNAQRGDITYPIQQPISKGTADYQTVNFTGSFNNCELLASR